MTDLEDGEIDMDTALSLLSISEFKDKSCYTKQNITEALSVDPNESSENGTTTR